MGAPPPRPTCFFLLRVEFYMARLGAALCMHRVIVCLCRRWMPAEGRPVGETMPAWLAIVLVGASACGSRCRQPFRRLADFAF